MSFPVIYPLDDEGEATGTVHPFCSQACATAFQEDEAAKVRMLIGLEAANYAWSHLARENLPCDPSDSQCVECGCTLE